MKELFLNDLRENSRPVLAAAETPMLLQGVFIAVENSVVRSFIYQMSSTTAQKNYDVKLELLNSPPPECTFVCGIGRRETIDEINRGSTPRAKKWKATLSRLQESQRAVEAVRLTIQSHPRSETVGGAIDAVDISNSGVRWVQAKAPFRN